MHRQNPTYSGSKHLIHVFALFSMMLFSGCSWLMALEKIFWPNKENHKHNENPIIEHHLPHSIAKTEEKRDSEESDPKLPPANKDKDNNYTKNTVYSDSANSYHSNQSNISSQICPQQQVSVGLSESADFPSSNPSVVVSSGIARSEKSLLNETGVEQNKTDQKLKKEIESDQKLQDSQPVERTDKNNNNIEKEEEEEKEEENSNLLFFS